MNRIVEATDQQQWNDTVQACHGHPLQLWQWGELKADGGLWSVRRLLVFQDDQLKGGAQILTRRLPWPLCEIAYAPRGPFVARGGDQPMSVEELADVVAQWVRTHTKAISLKIDPALTELALNQHWEASGSVMLAATAVIDLEPDTETIRQGLHSKKTRQYIRKAEREGVVCRPARAEDLDTILAIYHETADNDQFGLHHDHYYRQAFALFGSNGQVFVAEVDGKVEAFLWNITSQGGTAFELWGGVTSKGKQAHANYLLKWNAIVAAKEFGARLYDLNGLLNEGINRFKLGFVSEQTTWVGTFDRPLSLWYRPWTWALSLRKRLRGAA